MARKIKDAITSRPRRVSHDVTMPETAEEMKMLNVGFLPVHDNDWA